MSPEDQIILSSINLNLDGSVEYGQTIRQTTQLLEKTFGKAYNYEMVKSRRKRIVKNLHKIEEDDPHDLHEVEFLAGQTCLVLNDLHIPYHDPASLAIAYAIARDAKPTHLIFNGDTIDCTSISSFLHSPKIKTIAQECDIARPILTQFRSLRSVRYAEYKFGNHEFRSIRRKWDGSGNNDLTNLLDLKRWVVTGYHQDTELAPYSGDGFRVTHGEIVRGKAGTSAEAECNARLLSGLSGHTHRVAIYSRTAGRKQLTWVENGCLCQKTMPYLGAKGADWQQAITILHSDGHHVHPELIQILEHKAYFNGRLYTKGS